MIAAGLGCAFERDNLWNDHRFLAGGAVAIELSIGTDDSFGTSLADREGIAATDACLGATVG